MGNVQLWLLGEILIGSVVSAMQLSKLASFQLIHTESAHAVYTHIHTHMHTETQPGFSLTIQRRQSLRKASLLTGVAPVIQ